MLFKDKAPDGKTFTVQGTRALLETLSSKETRYLMENVVDRLQVWSESKRLFFK